MSEPLYKKVFNTVIQRIVNSEYVPGSMLPSEFDLAAELAVSQGTARKALIELEQKRIVERRQGKGTFVTLRTPENSLFHFFRLRTSEGEQVSPQLLTERVTGRNATKEEKSALFGNPGKVFEISRVRTFQDKPLCHEQIVVPAALFPGLMEREPLPNALYVLFQHAYSCIIISAQENLSAGVLTAQIASEMKLEVNKPVIVARRRSFDLQDRVVELRTSTLVTDDASYFVEMF